LNWFSRVAPKPTCLFFSKLGCWKGGKGTASPLAAHFFSRLDEMARFRIGKATGNFTLRSDAEGIARAAAKDFLKQLNARIRQRLPELREKLKAKVEEWLLTSVGFQLLDSYRGELGVVDMEAAKQAIAKRVADTLIVKFISFKRSGGNRIVGGLKVMAAPVDVSYLLDMKEAYAGGYFPWLEAVLTAGDEVFVKQYFYSSKILSPEKLAAYSRTGEGIMLKGARGWGVPASIAGVEGDNIISRALQSREVEAYLKSEFEKVL